MNGFIAWVTEYWKYLVFLVIAVIAAVIVFVKSNKAYSAYYARYRTEEEQMKHLVEMKERFSPLTKEIIASASEEELLMGAALAYQVKIQKQDNIDEAFMLLTDEKKYVYTLDVFVSDESVGVFFRENGSQLKNLLVPALEMIGMPDTAKRAEKIRLMFDEKDETVSFSEKRIAEMQEYIDSGDILTKIKLHSAQYIKANPEKFI